MGMDASTVSLTINVVDANSGNVVTQVIRNIDNLGAAGTRSGQQMRHGFEEGAAGSTSSLHHLHLLEEEVGIHLPRAFTRLAAESKAAQVILGSLGSAMMGLGAIQIGWMVGSEIYEGAKKIYEKWLDVDGALEKYQTEAAKSAQIKLFDEGGIQTQISMLGEVSRQIDQLNQKRQGSTGFLTSFLLGSGYDYFSPDDQKRLNDLMSQADKGKLAGLETGHKENLRQLQNQETVALARVKEPGRPAVERLFADRRAQEEQSFVYNRDNFTAGIYNRGKAQKDQIFISKDDGSREAQNIRENAKAKADATDIEHGHTTQDALRKLQEEAREADLHGIALLEQRRRAADDDWLREHPKVLDGIKALDEKFHAEEAKLIEDQARQTMELAHQVEMIGMSGMGRIQAEGTFKEGQLDQDKNLSPEVREERRKLIRRQTDAEMLEDQRSFSQEMDEIAERSLQREERGYTGIQAAADRQIAENTRKFDTVHAGLNLAEPGVQARFDTDTQKLGETNTAVQTGADRQKNDLANKTRQETEQIEAQSRVRSLSAEKQKTASIEAEYQERIARWKETLDWQGRDEADFNRRSVAAAQERDAQMAESQREARQKMAGEFTSFFRELDHPTQALAHLGDKVAGEAAASLVQRAQNKWGGRSQSGPDRTGTPGTGWFGNAMSKIAGTTKGTAEAESTHAEPGKFRGLSSTKQMTLSSAQISIGTASLSFGTLGMPSGGGAARATGEGSSLVSPGGFSSASTSTEPGVFSSSAATGTAGRSPSALSSASSGTLGGVYSGSDVPGTPHSTVSSTISLASQGKSLFDQAKGTFGFGKKSAQNSDKLATDTDPVRSPDDPGASKANGGMLGGGGVKANAMDAASGALGMYSAYEGNGGLGGAASGAMSGMELGMALGGPIGAGIGAAAGAIVGAIGFGGREKARVYWLKNGRPRMANDTDSFQQGTMDYTSALSDIESLKAEANRTTNSMGPAAKSYYQGDIKPEIAKAEANLTREQKAGRSRFTASGAEDAGSGTQAHQGGWMDDFGSMSTGSNTGWAHMRSGEFVVNEQPAAEHAGALEAIRSGASHADMASYYGGGSTVRPEQPHESWSGDIHIHAMDTQTGVQWLLNNKHAVRSAVSASYAENSGGADA